MAITTNRSSLQVLESTGPARAHWLALLASWPGREVFADPGYLDLYAEPGSRPVCVVYHGDGGRVIHPLLLRDLRACPFWGPDGEELYDTTSPPYGYGGPFVDGEGDRATLIGQFFEEYTGWAASHHVVCDYATFSPKEELAPPYPGEVIVRAPTVVRSLALSAEAIWWDYRGSVRNKIRLAERAGLTLEFDPCGARALDFLEVYEETSRRRQVPAGYAVSAAFLERLHAALAGHYFYGHALLDGRVVASELVLVSGDSTFFFRGGSRTEAWSARPANLLMHQITLWSLQAGKRFYLMGAGVTGDDSLYRFKLGFAPHGARPLRVGRWILDHDRYARLVAARRAHEEARGERWSPVPDYFPCYRAPSLS